MVDASNRKTVEHIKVAADGCFSPYTLSVTDTSFNRDRYFENDMFTANDTGTPVSPDLAVTD